MIKLFRQYYPVRNVLFVITESIFIFMSILAATMLIDPESNVFGGKFFLLNVLIITAVCQICIYYSDLYDMKLSIGLKTFGVKLLQALIAASIFVLAFYAFFPGWKIKPDTFLLGTILMMIMIGSTRFFYNLILERGLFNQRIMLLGDGTDLSQKIISEIQHRSDCGYEISYVVQNQLKGSATIDSGTPFIQNADYSNLCEIAKELGIKTIVVAIKDKRGKFPSAELLNCRISGLEIIEGNSFYEMLKGKLIVDELYPSWLIFSNGFQKTLVRRIFKRTFDIILSIIMLILFFPLMVLVALLIKIDSKGPIFYSQERVGQNHKIYNIFKFRSMVNNAEEKSGPQFASENDPRITRVGYFLRKLRIDEMPQLWNVLKGEMSFVGPRPEREVFVREYEQEIPYYRERFSIKPGITGWAQICYPYGANTEDTIEKLNYDMFYIKNMSILMDIMIVLRTIKIVIFGKGAR